MTQLRALAMAGLVGLGTTACVATTRTLVHAPADAFAEPEPPDSTVVAAWLGAAVALRSDDPGQAAARLESAVHAAPEDGLLRLRYADALQRAGQHDQAELQCRVAASLDVGASRRAPVCAPVLTHLDASDRAWSLWIEGSRDPEVTEAFFDTWVADAAAVGTDQAISAADRYTERFPEAPAAWRALGVARRTAGEHAAAAVAFGRAAELPGGDGWDGEQAVTASRAAGDDVAAAAYSALCTSRYREHLPCTVLAIAVASDDATRQQAIERLAQRVAGDAGRIRAAGRVLLGQELDEVTEPWLLEVAALRPRNVASLSAAAWTASAAGLRTLAVDLMHQVLAVDGSNADALNFIAYEWAEQRLRLDQAEVYAREAMRLRPGDSNIADTLGWVLFGQGRLDEAVELLEYSVETNPESAVLLDHLGEVYRALGRSGEAVKAWQRALQFATPADEDVLSTVPAKLEELGAPIAPHPGQ